MDIEFFELSTIVIISPSSNKLKTVRALAGYDTNGAGVIFLGSGLYYTNTNAVTSIRILTESNAFTQNTQIALYGILG